MGDAHAAARTPLERFQESEKIFAQYLALGGTLDPDPDPTSPFYDPSEWNPNAAHGRAGLRVKLFGVPSERKLRLCWVILRRIDQPRLRSSRTSIM
jgi:hypothetical protein